MKKNIALRNTIITRMLRKEVVIIVLLVLCLIPAILPLLHKGFFVTDDGAWMIIRLSAFYETLKAGQFPVRLVERLNFGYGYPVGEFLYPGIMYFGSFLHIIRFGFINAIKIIMLISLIGSGIFTYKWLTNIFSKSASFVGAIVAVYLPYHLYDAYFRGSIGELFALFWVPFLLWMIERKSKFFISISVFMLILSHNSLALLFLPIIFIYSILRDKKNIKSNSISYLLGIGMSSFFIIPAIAELHYTVFSTIQVSNPLNYFASIQLIGYLTIISLTAILTAIFISRKKIKNTALLIFFLIINIGTIFFASPLSTFFWSIVPANFIQFPFRFLSYLVIAVPFVVAVCIEHFHIKRYLSIIIIILVTFFSALPYLQPSEYMQKEDAYFATNDATTTVKDEYMPIWVKSKPLSRPESEIIISKGAGSITNFQSNGRHITFNIKAKTPMHVQVQKLYWPGWVAKIDNKPVPIAYNNNNGLLAVSVPMGEHAVSFLFAESPIRYFSNILSLLSFFGLILFNYVNILKLYRRRL